MTVATLALAGQGGSGKVGRVCADAAAHAGHRSILLTGADGFWERETQHDYVVRPVDAPQTPTRPEPGWVDKLAGQIAQSVREEGIEVLAVHYVAGLLDAALLAREQLRAEGRTLAVTATLHGTDISTWGKDAEYGPKLGALLKQCDDVTAVSEWLADTSLKLLDLEQRPRVISNAIETETFNASGWATPAAQGAGSDIRRALAPHDEVVLISVTNLRAVKRPRTRSRPWPRFARAA
ncbi:MAG: glycosyltransferase [Archangiaceae bacterium]|nr:glycosyltransferase [Archangiaceae bacterium]